MKNLSMYKKLLALPHPIKTLIVGMGDFGAQTAAQIERIPNMHASISCDKDIEKARRVLIESGVAPEKIAFADNASKMNTLIENDFYIITDNAFEAVKANIDAVCDSTGEPYFGAELALKSIQNGKHTIVVNIESDVGAGAALVKKAQQAGVVYTEADGDQPSLIMGLCDNAMCLGLDIIAVGKWTSIYPEHMRITKGKRSDVGYYDGSKNQIEMCCVANMTGFLPDIRGMHKPSLAFDEIVNSFCSAEDGGIFSKYGIVDVVNCLSPDAKTEIEKRFGGGVFIIVRSDNPYFSRLITSKHISHSKDGKRALLYRPYHLVGIEAPMSIIRAVLYNEATAAPLSEPVACVCAIAKKDLPIGTKLDGIGGDTVRGEIESIEESKNGGHLPLCLAEEVVLKTAVKKGEIIKHNMLEKDGNNIMWEIRR